MSGVTATTVRDNIVYVDSQYTHRWIDAIGPDVVKCIENFVVFPLGDTNSNPSAYTTTEVGTNTIALQASTDGGTCVITTGGTENNGMNVQLNGEAFKLSNNYPCYFGCKFQISDADQSDICIGLCITDTTAATAVSDGLYFRSVDESATLNWLAEMTNGETVAAAATMTDATWYIVEWYFDGATATAYVNGSEVASVAATDDNFPDDEHLTPTFAVLTGATAVTTLTLDWLRAIQIRN